MLVMHVVPWLASFIWDGINSPCDCLADLKFGISMYPLRRIDWYCEKKGRDSLCRSSTDQLSTSASPKLLSVRSQLLGTDLKVNLPSARISSEKKSER